MPAGRLRPGADHVDLRKGIHSQRRIAALQRHRLRAPDPFPLTGDWRPNQGPPGPDPLYAIIDQTFPKGRSFARWLQNVGASAMRGRIEIKDARHDINRARKPPSQRWIYGDDDLNDTPDVMLHMTFNTPIVLAPPDLAGVSMDGGVPDGGWGP